LTGGTLTCSARKGASRFSRSLTAILNAQQLIRFLDMDPNAIRESAISCTRTGRLIMLRRLSLILTLIVLAGMAVAGSAFAHIPLGSPEHNPQWGCITTRDPWNATAPYGPFNSALVAPVARDNTCGTN
jgi:hypothetical protein